MTQSPIPAALACTHIICTTCILIMKDGMCSAGEGQQKEDERKWSCAHNYWPAGPIVARRIVSTRPGNPTHPDHFCVFCQRKRFTQVGMTLPLFLPAFTMTLPFGAINLPRRFEKRKPPFLFPTSSTCFPSCSPRFARSTSYVVSLVSALVLPRIDSFVESCCPVPGTGI